MTAPETVVPDVSSAPTLDQELGEFFGDYRSSDGEPPEPEASAAGSTPAEPAKGTAPETPETPALAPADAASDGSTPDAPPADADWLATTEPATYVVNGKSVPVDDIRVFKEGGAVIQPDRLPNVLAKLAERDTLSEQSRTVKQQYDTLSKVSEWTGADNRTVTGPEAAIERIVAHAAVLSENNLIIEQILKSPDLYGSGFLITDPNNPKAVIFNPVAIENLKTQNELRQLKASQAIRDHYKGILAESSKPTPAPIDFAQATPELVGLVAKQANLDASVLTPADRAMLAEQLPFHIKDGLASVPWQNLVKTLIQDRISHKSSTASIVSATEKATKDGQARMAAAARGVKQPVKPTAQTPVKRINPVQQNQADAWDIMEKASATAMRSRG